MDVLEEKPDERKDEPARVPMNGWEFFDAQISKFLLTGYGAGLLTGATIIGMVWVAFGRMTSEDQRLALVDIVTDPWVIGSGWGVAGFVIVISRYIVKTSKKAMENQLRVAQENKERALTIHEKLPLSNIEPEKSKE
ncbi:MAG: hypothetical protein AAGA96_09805 [Verrucomicrobiota bacterium]